MQTTDPEPTTGEEVLHTVGVFTAEIIRLDGSREHLGTFRNARVNAGASAQANNMSGTQVAPFNYLACSPTVLTPAMGDTTLSGELSTNGFTRALASFGSYTAPTTVGGAASYVISHTFTATATQTISSVALFNAASAGTMFSEANLPTAAALNNGESLAITYTISI